MWSDLHVDVKDPVGQDRTLYVYCFICLWSRSCLFWLWLSHEWFSLGTNVPLISLSVALKNLINIIKGISNIKVKYQNLTRLCLSVLLPHLISKNGLFHIFQQVNALEITPDKQLIAAAGREYSKLFFKIYVSVSWF